MGLTVIWQYSVHNAITTDIDYHGRTNCPESCPVGSYCSEVEKPIAIKKQIEGAAIKTPRDCKVYLYPFFSRLDNYNY